MIALAVPPLPLPQNKLRRKAAAYLSPGKACITPRAAVAVRDAMPAPDLVDIEDDDVCTSVRVFAVSLEDGKTFWATRLAPQARRTERQVCVTSDGAIMCLLSAQLVILKVRFAYCVCMYVCGMC